MRGPKTRIYNASALESVQLRGGAEIDGQPQPYTRDVFVIEGKPGLWFRVARSGSYRPVDGQVLAMGPDGGVIQLARLRAIDEELKAAGFGLPPDPDELAQSDMFGNEQ